MKKKIAIVGAGIAGLYVANRLNSEFEITLFQEPQKDNVISRKLLVESTLQEITPISLSEIGGALNIWGGRLAVYNKDEIPSQFFGFSPAEFLSACQDFLISNFHQKLSKQSSDNGYKNFKERYFYIERTNNFLSNLKKNVQQKNIKIVKERVLQVYSEENTSNVYLRTVSKKWQCYHKVIICCGSIETVDLLAASGLNDEKIFFETHPKVSIGNIIISNRTFEKYKSKSDHNFRLESGFDIGDLANSHGLSSYFQLIPNPVDIIFSQKNSRTMILLLQHLATRVPAFLKIARRIYIIMNNLSMPHSRLYRVRMFSDLGSDTRVSYTDGLLNIQNHELYEQKIIQIADELGEIFKMTGFGKFEKFSDDKIKESIQYCHSHYTGGLNHIFKPNFEHVKASNVFTINAGLLPNVGYANPTLSLLVLAEKLSSNLIEKSMGQK